VEDGQAVAEVLGKEVSASGGPLGELYEGWTEGLERVREVAPGGIEEEEGGERKGGERSEDGEGREAEEDVESSEEREEGDF